MLCGEEKWTSIKIKNPEISIFWLQKEVVNAKEQSYANANF